MTVLPLKGYKALKALNAFHVLMLGLKMTPAFREKSYEEFFSSFEGRTEDEKETLVRQAVVLVPLEQSEVESLVSFVQDKNGVPYGAANLNNLSVSEIHEVIVSVCLEIGKIKVNLVTSEEKKSLKSSQST